MDVNHARMAARRRYGFTLIELLITLAVMAILAVSASAAMHSLSRSNALTAEINTFLSELHYARSEAIKRGRRMVLCPVIGTVCASTTSWRAHWMVFVDPDANNLPDAADAVLRMHRQPGHRTTMRSTAGRIRIAYRPDGSSTGSNGTFTFCDDAGVVPPRAVILSNTGRARVASQKPGGGALSC